MLFCNPGLKPRVTKSVIAYGIGFMKSGSSVGTTDVVVMGFIPL